MFSINSRVRIINISSRYYGMLGTVDRTPSNDRVAVVLDNGHAALLRASSIESFHTPPVVLRDTDKEKIGCYLLWNPTSLAPPRVLHDSEATANEVAATMAQRHGGTFLVAKIVGGRRLPVIRNPEVL